ncbi:FAD-dependent thymidylate synthase [Lyngbya confervoides]|uniref:FAD-dependent thymidylate synthase n=1 Tax=Lyngbya confervoides BDU141951 TaxID=1574623 RepID=A0ABD4T5Y5_9CYAN|nr:FAD-dependent thymidylate synthase [Lyngbya confervoides]MCM1983861.1 FAD-dependent thymidylate synthase [Lyngbya confervoides BDU141951]
MDSRFRVEVISQTQNPQQVAYAAMHQDYAEEFIWADRDRFPDEAKAGELLVKYLLKGNRGHYGPLEHPQIILNFGYFPHSTMQQMRTHRNVSFDVQCLAANSVITFVDAQGRTAPQLKKTIGELYDLWTYGEASERQRHLRGHKGEDLGTDRRDCKKRLKKMRLRVLNEATGQFETSHIKDVICSGLQPVYRVTLADGKAIDCTANHRLYTPQGWQTMGDAVGLETDAAGNVVNLNRTAEVMCNGLAVAEKGLYRHRSWLKEQLNPWNKGKARYHQNYPEHKFALEFQPISSSVKWQPKAKAFIAHPIPVIQVEYLGVQMTYDLEVEDPWHNFVANGMVVHNSFRYTGKRILDAAEGKTDLEEVFYLRPVGDYSDREGKKYHYSPDQREQDLAWCMEGCKRYAQRIHEGLAEEHARGLVPFDIRQHWVMSGNARSILHLLDIRGKFDVQMETRIMTEMMLTHFKAWMPQVAEWYEQHRWRKGTLAP